MLASCIALLYVRVLEFDKFYFIDKFLLSLIVEAKQELRWIKIKIIWMDIFFPESFWNDFDVEILTLCTVFAPSINSNKQDHDRVQDLFATLNFLILNRFRRLN